MAIILTDFTGNGNTLTNVNSATEVSSSLPFGDSTTAVALAAASSQLFTAADSATVSLTGNFTLEMWVKFASLPASNTDFGLLGKQDSSVANGFWFGLINSGGTLRLDSRVAQSADDTTRDIVRTDWTPSTNTWYHLAVTCTIANAAATTFEFYVDGSSLGNGSVIVGNNCASINDNTELLRIGASKDSGVVGSYFDGQIDDVRVWNTVRTGTEIANNRSSRLSGSESGLVAYWPFDNAITTSPRGYAFFM